MCTCGSAARHVDTSWASAPHAWAHPAAQPCQHLLAQALGAALRPGDHVEHPAAAGRRALSDLGSAADPWHLLLGPVRLRADAAKHAAEQAALRGGAACSLLFGPRAGSGLRLAQQVTSSE